jgi:hypothetical protein
MAAVLFFTVIYFVLAVPLAIGLGHLMHYRLPPRDDREVWKSGTAERLRVSNGTVRAVRASHAHIHSRSSRAQGIRGGGARRPLGGSGRWGDAARLPKRLRVKAAQID